VPEFNPLRDWPGSCKPTSIVRLDATCLGLRFTCAKGGKMTMPLHPATSVMFLPKPR
jgi:hypothetical protein